MTLLPQSLLDLVEKHSCFTGCYAYEHPIALCIDPSKPPVWSFHATCQDCLMFHVGAIADLLPPGMTQYTLTQKLNAHMRTIRGYRWSLSGYHATGPGFWLSVAYFGDGLFLVDGSRDRGNTKEIDLLVRAFQSKLAQPDDPGMLDPALYASEAVYLDMSKSLLGAKSKQDILKSPQCSAFDKGSTYKKVSIVEFLPITTKAASSQPASKQYASTGALARGLFKGDICSFCQQEVKERTLFVGSYIGCLCG